LEHFEIKKNMTTYNTIADFNNALALAKTNLPAIMLPRVRSGIATMAVSIRTRVSVRGETMDGGSFTAYSKGHKYKKTKYGNPPLGKKIDKKNFFLSGYMWSTFGVRSINVQGNRIASSVNFAGQNVYASNEEILGYNNEYEYGKGDSPKSLSYPTKEEEDVLVAAIEEALFQSLDKLL
jgi:hypothetical protein